MDPVLREILTAVREGRLDAVEGARLLQERTATAEPPPNGSQPAPAAARDEPGDAATDPAGDPAKPSSSVWAGVTDDVDAAADPEVHTPTAIVVDDRATTTLRVRAITRRVHVIGDPAVTTVSVDGPHELRREGSTLVLDSELDLPFGDPFAFLPTAMGRFRVQSPGRALKLGSELEIRVNPSLDVELDLTAGSLHVQGVRRLRARVTAGSARVEDVRGPLDLHVVGGTAKIDTVVAGGDNRIRCDSGSVVLRLRPGSNVRFRPEAQLGRIVINGVDGGREISVGNGTGRLRAEVVMGSIQIEVPG